MDYLRPFHVLTKLQLLRSKVAVRASRLLHNVIFPYEALAIAKIKQNELVVDSFYF